MSAQPDFTKFFSAIPNLCDPDAAKGGMASVAEFNAKLSTVAFDAAEKSTDVMTSSTKEALGNMRELVKVREPAAYGQAFAGFMQAQMQLAQSTAGALFEVAQGAGEQMSDIGTTATDKTMTAARKTTRSASARKTSSTAA